jgi:hypothetical protein
MLIGPNGVVLSTHPTGRESTITVAAANSSPISRTQADFVCDGIDDNVEIQAAIDACPENGKVFVSEGTINTTATINILKTLEFECLAVIKPAAGVNAIQLGDATNDADYSLLKVFQIVGVGKATAGKGIVFENADYSQLFFTKLGDLSTAIDFNASGGNCAENRIFGGNIAGCTTGINFSNSTNLMQGNWILASIFSCDTGIKWTSGGDSKYTHFNGVVDNTDVSGTDFDDAVGQHFLSPYYFRESDSTLAALSTIIAPSMKSRITQVIRKGANEIVNNSSTLQDDDDFVFRIDTTGEWEIELVLRIVSGATPGFKYAFTLPALAAIRLVPADGSIGSEVDVTAAQTLTTDGTSQHIHLRFWLVSGGTAGNVQFQWAQNVADASDTTVRAQSYMKFTRIY